MTVFSNEVTFRDSANLDAFSRLRVSNLKFLFEAQLTYDLQPLVYEQITTGAGASIAHDTTNRMAQLNFTATPGGGECYMQTYEYFRYRPSRSQFIAMTFNFQNAVANVTKFIGYSDGVNGIEFRNDGVDNQFAVLSGTGVGDQIVNQANWNLDKLDGTGPSGITFDISKTHILILDFQSLYVGRVRIGFDIDGIIIYAHEFTHANIEATPYLQDANLPLRCGMTCTATASTSMNFICSSASSEGLDDKLFGYNFTTPEGNVTAASGARTHLLSVRPKTTFNSFTNRTTFILDSINMLVTGTNHVYWELVLGDALTGTTTFNDINTTYSATEYNTAATTSGTPTLVIASGYLPATNSVKSSISEKTTLRYPITLDAAGNQRSLGTLTLLVTGIGGTSAVQGSFTFGEVR